MAQSVGDSSDERLPTEMDKILNLNTENADKSYILLNVIQHLLEEVAELKQKLWLQETGNTDAGLLKVNEIHSDRKCKAGEKLIIEAESFKCKGRDVQNFPSTKSDAAGISYSDKKYKVNSLCHDSNSCFP